MKKSYFYSASYLRKLKIQEFMERPQSNLSVLMSSGTRYVVSIPDDVFLECVEYLIRCDKDVQASDFSCRAEVIIFAAEKYNWGVGPGAYKIPPMD